MKTLRIYAKKILPSYRNFERDCKGGDFVFRPVKKDWPQGCDKARAE